MDDVKMFTKKVKELETIIHAVRIYSQNIVMEFGVGKIAMLMMKDGKRHLINGMELPRQDKMRTLGEKKSYKYLGKLEADTIKRVEIYEKNKRMNISGERESYSRQNYLVETLSKK